MDKRTVAELIVDRLVQAGMPAFPSHQFGFVDKYKAQELVEQVLKPYDLRYSDQVIAAALKKKKVAVPELLSPGGVEETNDDIKKTVARLEDKFAKGDI